MSNQLYFLSSFKILLLVAFFSFFYIQLVKADFFNDGDLKQSQKEFDQRFNERQKDAEEAGKLIMGLTVAVFVVILVITLAVPICGICITCIVVWMIMKKRREPPRTVLY